MVNPGVFLLFDPTGKILAWNRGAHNTYGWSEAEALQMNIRDMTPPGRIAELVDLILRLVAGETIASFETQRLTKDGRILDIWLTATALGDKDKKTTVAIAATERDITGRKKAEKELRDLTEELKRSNAELEQFAYAASHDMREPLRTVSGFLKLLEKRYKGKLDEKAEEYISFTIDSVARMDMVLKDLLEFSRLGAKAHHMKPLNCSVVFEQAIHNLRSAIEESGAEITYDLLPTVMANESQITSLFQNLLSNSMKFRGKEKLRIHVSAEQKDNQWVFSVQDNGIGIDPKFFDRIFVIFQKLHTKQEYEGTGVGLTLCKKIVELHGGRIWVESEPGKGATFYFALPLLDIPPKD